MSRKICTVCKKEIKPAHARITKATADGIKMMHRECDRPETTKAGDRNDRT